MPLSTCVAPLKTNTVVDKRTAPPACCQSFDCVNNTSSDIEIVYSGKKRPSFLISPTYAVGAVNADHTSKRTSSKHGKLRFLVTPDPSEVPSDTLAFALKRPRLSEEEERIVLDSWKILREDTKRTGNVTFLSMFNVYPEMLPMFARYRGLSPESIENTATIVEHGMFVMSYVEKTIARLEEHENLESILHEVGDIHRQAGMRREVLTKIIPFFINAIKPAFDNWTEELERAWVKFMRLMCHVICERMHP